MPKDIELGVRLTADGKGFVGAVTGSPAHAGIDPWENLNLLSARQLADRPETQTAAKAANGARLYESVVELRRRP